MKIQVLGTGCAKCKKLLSETEKAVNASGMHAHIEKVESIEEIVASGVMMTPALVVDGEVKSTGRIPNASEITSWLLRASAKAGT